MTEPVLITGNEHKYLLASTTFAHYGLTLSHETPHIDEIQAEDSEVIARHKADSAFKLMGRPVIISDDSWSIPGLNGFPGPYMKSMNHWLTTDDFVRLTAPLQDRTTILHQILVYQDADGQQLFRFDVPAIMLKEPRGESSIPWTTLVCLEGDDGLTIAEVRNPATDHKARHAARIWHDLINWLQENRP